MNDNKFDLILADPPWKQSKGGKKNVRKNSSGTDLDYPVMSLRDIVSVMIRAKNLCNENHILFMWTIDKYLHESEMMALSLGYKLHARMIWNKVTGIPAAFTIRYGHEYLLYFYSGKLLPVALDIRGKIHSVFTERVVRHSKKPEISYEIIEALYPNAKKLELFARQNRIDWDVWGNEVESTVSLQRKIKRIR